MSHSFFSSGRDEADIQASASTAAPGSAARGLWLEPLNVCCPMATDDAGEMASRIRLLANHVIALQERVRVLEARG